MFYSYLILRSANHSKLSIARIQRLMIGWISEYYPRNGLSVIDRMSVSTTGGYHRLGWDFIHIISKGKGMSQKKILTVLHWNFGCSQAAENAYVLGLTSNAALLVPTGCSDNLLPAITFNFILRLTSTSATLSNLLFLAMLSSHFLLLWQW